MAPGNDIFHPDFKAAPWWWEAWTPNNALSQDPPLKTDVVIVGAGYGGLSTALELRRNGVGAVVLERGDFGVGASTRNGGMISGGVNMGKGLGGKSQAAEEFEAKKAAFLGAGADSLSVLEDIIAREKIECGVIKQGRFVGAWTPKHYAEQAAKVEMFNKYADVGAEMVPRERQREFIASDYYFGGMYARRSGHLHPALYYKGLLEAAHRAGAILCANVEAERTEKIARRLARADLQGADRGQGGRDRDQRLYRRSHAPAEAPRRAGGEPHHRHRRAARACQQARSPSCARSPTPSAC